MMQIDEIRILAAECKIQWTNHCAKQMVERDISRADVFHCIAEGEIIEDYPDAFPYPCSLVFGYTVDGRTIHTVVGSNGEKLYKADPFANKAELRPGTASVTTDISKIRWSDSAWMKKRAGANRSVFSPTAFAGVELCIRRMNR